MDMLIGLHAAALFPTVENSEQDVVSNLCLLSTKFGTGWLVDGQYPVVGPSRTSQALHSKIGTMKKARCKTRRTTDHVMSVRDKEIGERRPRQCGAGTDNKTRSYGVMMPSKRDAWELQSDSRSSDKELLTSDIKKPDTDSTTGSAEDRWSGRRWRGP